MQYSINLQQNGRSDMKYMITIKNAEYATLRAVGIICPPPLCIGSCAITASNILNFTFLMAVKEKKFIQEYL